MEAEWQTQGDLASVTCEFETDNVVANIGGFVPDKLGGDYNNDYNEDFDNWKDIFTRFVDGSKGKKQIIDKETMAETIKNMGFKVNDEDIQELIGKMDGDLDETKFCDIMRYVETRFQRMQRRK